MARPSDDGSGFVYIEGEVTVWYDPNNGDIHLSIDDPDFRDPHNPRKGAGLMFTTNGNIDSANYVPAAHNRMARVLRQYHKPAPAADVREGPRRLDRRGWRKVRPAEG